MENPGWSKNEPLFHPGEQAIHIKLGTHERLETQARQGIRTYLIEQHRQFFAQIPYVIV